ncbi:MAG: endonuclease/exonuclease/phosphatase family protein [Bacilli bacterium]|nr:endonuclease/exonuclease/phosphatase family protein [Bacilli bacterium]MBN2697094.1 endonuclease/exonuclease/phosphatase family protein [Bacilli bacterium]
MKLMTFNLRCDVQSDGENYWPHRIVSVVETIRHNDPDVIGFQEVTDRMVNDLRPMFADYYVMGEGRNKDLSGERCSVFVRKSRFELLDSETFWLSSTPKVPGSMDVEEGFPRICTVVEVSDNLKASRKMRVMNVHFAYRSERTRLTNVDTLLRYYASYQALRPMPTVIMGDLNIGIDHEVHSRIRFEGFTTLFDENTEATFHGFAGGVGISLLDYIYVTPDIELLSMIIDKEKRQNRFPSDHYPVIAKISVET